MHESILCTLKQFYDLNKIPNIIFYGPCGSGKKHIVFQFINMIYNHNNDYIDKYVITVNCAHGKGIKFIREELKFFAKTNIHVDKLFKSIILINADKLTIDAQSALRRCIELFSFSTRFFIVTDDKSKLLKPILSRFSEIYVPLPIIDDKEINLHSYINVYNIQHNKDKLIDIMKILSYEKLIEQVNEIYNLSYSCIDIIDYIFNHETNIVLKYKIMLLYNKIKYHFRNEKLLMYHLLIHYI
jgi:DNA polymerase III delta prime subunit